MTCLRWLLPLLTLCLTVTPLYAEGLEPWLTKLNSRVTKDRTEAEGQLKQLVKAPDLPKLVKFYKTCEMMACYVVIRLVDRVGGAPAKAALKQMVPLRQDYGAYYAASSLRNRHGDLSGFDYLLGKIRSPETPENFRYTLINTLASMGKAGRKALVDLAADTQLKNRLRIQALDRLASTSKQKDEARVVASLKDVVAPKLRIAGDVYLYTRRQLTDVTRLDAAALAGKLEYSQAYALLRAIEKRKDIARKKVLIYLVEKGQSGYVKANALRTMAKIGLVQLAVKKAQAYLNDKDSYLKREARQLMVEYGSTSIEDLKKQLKLGSTLDRVDAAEMLVKLDDYSGVEVLLEALAEGKVEARRKAAAVLGQVLSRKALPALAKAMNDKDSTVRSQAHSSFRRLAGAMLPYRNLDWRKVGYAYNATAKSRQAAVEKLTAWLKLVLPPK